MALNYTKRLQNLNERRNPDGLSKSFSDGLSARNYSNFIGAIGAVDKQPTNLKYLRECMSPIDKEYNDNTLLASDKVRIHLENEFNLHFSRDYRKQGSVMTNTNIKSYSDVDLLAIIGRYYYLAPSLPNNDPYTASNPDDDIKEIRRQATIIMQNVYDLVNTTGAKNISIYNKSLKRKVDIVFAYWYNTEQYVSTNDEYYRGIYLYDFQKQQRELDYPFAHIYAVNTKGDQTNDGSRRVIRLLKSLKMDSEGRIDLTSFQLTAIAHDITDSQVTYSVGNDLALAKSALAKVSFLIDNRDYRKAVSSPAGNQKPLYEDSVVPDLKELQKDLSELITDCETEINSFKSRTFVN